MDSKILTKVMHDIDNSNGDSLFVQKSQTRIIIFKGFHLPPTTTAVFELSGFQTLLLSTAPIGKPGFTYCDMFTEVYSEDPV